MPLLPNLDLKNDPAELTELVQTYKQEVTEAACELICDWAQKILKRSFDTVVEIARYLIQEHIVNPRCSQAELVTSAALAGGPAKPHKVIKKTPLVPKAESDGAAEHKRDQGDSSSSSSLKPPPGDKSATKPLSMEAPPPPSSSSLRPAVEAFMKQLPRILPRSSIPDKSQLSVRSSPPSLAPKDAAGAGGASGPGGPAAAAATAGGGGGVKVIAMATLPQQQGGPLPVMFLPQGCLPYERDAVGPPPQPAPQQQHATAAPTSVLQKARGSKRPLEATPGASATPPVKRKRGRPRKQRPEDAAAATAAPPPAPPPHPPIITSLSGGVIQKASSSSSSAAAAAASSQPVLELVLGPLPATSDSAHRLVQCSPGAEPDRHGRPLLVFQSPANPGWELAAGRTPMVEVIQKTPRPGNNSAAPPALHPPLPLPTLREEQGEMEVEITLTPISPPLPSSSAAAAAAPPSPSSSSLLTKSEEEQESSTSAKTEGQ
ncbi:uncharacterized protein V6R79_019437 [Siganus canaliculatus]